MTCAYFSVSAILNCFKPWLLIYSPNVFFKSVGLNAIWTFGIVASYWVKQTKYRFLKSLVSNSLNSLSTKVLVISLALSGLKLKNITESLSSILATGLSPLNITVGSTNSSKTSFWYEASIAISADVAFTPSPLTIAS